LQETNPVSLVYSGAVLGDQQFHHVLVASSGRKYQQRRLMLEYD
jgi:hypothetical protein